MNSEGTEADGASARTAIGPSSDSTAPASGSVVPRHSQPSFFGFERCIGHSVAPACAQVQVTESDACGMRAKSDSGAAVKIEI